jgi:glycosyltransferase involved in cell wall biosynthesis
MNQESKKFKLITIIIPCYNESEVLNLLWARLSKFKYNNKQIKFNYLFVNDGSTDDTLEIIKKLSKYNNRVSYLSLSRNFGKEIAMIASLDHVKKINTDAAVIIDADLQDPPELIPQMIDFWLAGYDDVYAKRKSRAGESYIKKKTSEIFYKVLQKSTKVPIQVDTGDFRLLSKRVIVALTEMRETQRYTKGMFSWVGFKKKEILYDRDPRAAGGTKWNYWKLTDLAIEGITSFTTLPLRVATLIGFVISFASFIYIVVIIINTVINSSVPGYPSIMAVVLFLGGIQLITIGIIGEYIGRIFNETKNRPLYFIDEEHRARLIK